MGIWDNAFKIPEPPEPTPEEKRLLDGLAEKVRARGLGDVASFSVESTKPLHGVGAGGAAFLAPILGVIFKKEKIDVYRALLENPKAMDYLAQRLGAETSGKEDPNVKKRP